MLLLYCALCSPQFRDTRVARPGMLHDALIALGAPPMPMAVAKPLLLGNGQSVNANLKTASAGWGRPDRRFRAQSSKPQPHGRSHLPKLGKEPSPGAAYLADSEPHVAISPGISALGVWQRRIGGAPPVLSCENGMFCARVLESLWSTRV